MRNCPLWVLFAVLAIGNLRGAPSTPLSGLPPKRPKGEVPALAFVGAWLVVRTAGLRFLVRKIGSGEERPGRTR